MRHHRLGSTDLVVSEVGFGCARLGGVFGHDTQRDMLVTLRTAFDLGVTFFDTADMYTQGESEKLLGRAFRHDRDRVVIATKGGYRLPSRKSILSRVKPVVRPIIQRAGIRRPTLPARITGSLSQDFSEAYITRAVERSIQRLGTDYLDLYQLHSPPTVVLERGDVFMVLERLQAAGKIRHYGVSCETCEDARLCLRYSGIASLQVRVSLLDQEALVHVLPWAAARGVPIIARECFGGGALARQTHRVPVDDSVHTFISGDMSVRDYRRIAEKMQRPLSEVALQFVRAQPAVSVTLVGMRTQQHVREAILHAMSSPLSGPDMEMFRSSREAITWAGMQGTR